MVTTKLKKLVVPTLTITTMMGSTYGMEEPSSIEAAQKKLIHEFEFITTNPQLLYTIELSEFADEYNKHLTDLKSGDIQKTLEAAIKIGQIELQTINGEGSEWLDEQKLLTQLTKKLGSEQTELPAAMNALAQRVTDNPDYATLWYDKVELTNASEEITEDRTFIVGDIPATYLKEKHGTKLRQDKPKILKTIVNDYTIQEIIKDYNKFGLTSDELKGILPEDLTNDKDAIIAALKGIDNNPKFQEIYVSRLADKGIEIEESDKAELKPTLQKTVEENWNSEKEEILNKYDIVEIDKSDIDKYSDIVNYITAKTKMTLSPIIKHKKPSEDITLTKLYGDAAIQQAFTKMIETEQTQENRIKGLIEDLNKKKGKPHVKYTNTVSLISTLATNYKNMKNDLISLQFGTHKKGDTTKLETDKETEKKLNNLIDENNNLKSKLSLYVDSTGKPKNPTTLKVETAQGTIRKLTAITKDSNQIALIKQLIKDLGISPEAIFAPKKK